MKNIFDKIKTFILNNYYIIISFLFLMLIGYDYLKFGLNKYMFIFIIFEIYNILKIFNFKMFEKKIFNILPKNKFIYLIFLICLYSGVNTYRANAGISVYSSKPGADISDAIMVEEVKQEIPNSYNYFDTVSIQFATYARENDAHYKFLLFENDILIREITFNAKKLEDGKYKKFIFDGVNVDHNKKYSFSIKPLYATSNNCISIFKDNNTNELNYQLSINKKIDWFKLIITTFLVLVFFIINYFINTRNISVARMYVIFSIYLVSMLFLIPANNVPDEYVHFARAYKLSQIYDHLGDRDYMSNSYYYGPNVDCLFYGNPETLVGVDDRTFAIDCLGEKENEYREGYNFNNLLAINPLEHFVPSLGIKIIDIFTNSPLIIFMFGRLFNFLLSFALIIYILKNIKINKILILFVALLPMFIQQGISYSYDSIVNSCMLFFVYMVTKLLNNDNISKIDWFLFGLSFIYVFFAKWIYLILTVPIIFRKTNTAGLKNILKKSIPFLVILFFVTLIYKVWFGYIYNIPGDISISNVPTNIDFIKSNPLYIFTLGWNTIYKMGWFYIESLIGYFGWFVFKFDFYIYIIYLIFIYLILYSNQLTENIFARYQKVISIICCLLAFSAVFASMYFFWSSYMLDYVDGVQGRYFLPILPLFLIVLIPRNRKIDFKLTNNDVYSFLNIMLLLTIIVILANVY